MPGQDELRALIEEHKRRLHELELKQARFGWNTPPEVLMEIDDLKSQLGQLEKELAAAAKDEAAPGPVTPEGGKLSAPSAAAPVAGASSPSGAGRPLRVFMAHASEDKAPVRSLYDRLVKAGVDAWLDEEKLLPGQDWQLEIRKAVRASDVVLVFLSNKAVSKTGYVQKEIKLALDVADEQPEGAIFLIPARLEECLVPDRLQKWQWVDLFGPNGWDRLVAALCSRAAAVGAIAAFLDR